MTLHIATISQHHASSQKVKSSGRIATKKKAWIVRITALSIVTYVIFFNLQNGLEMDDPLVVYSTLMPIHALLIMLVGWFFYKNPAKGKVGSELVSVIVPVYNQEAMVEIVV